MSEESRTSWMDRFDAEPPVNKVNPTLAPETIAVNASADKDAIGYYNSIYTLLPPKSERTADVQQLDPSPLESSTPISQNSNLLDRARDLAKKSANKNIGHRNRNKNLVIAAGITTIFGIGTTACDPLGLFGSGSAHHGRPSASGPASKNTKSLVSCEYISMDDTAYPNGAFLPDQPIKAPSNANKAAAKAQYVQEAGEDFVSWFNSKTGPLNGHFNRATLAMMEAAIVDPASGKEINNAFSYEQQFRTDYNWLGSHTKSRALDDCNELQRVMTETESYDNNIAVNGHQNVAFVETYNKQGQVNGMDVEAPKTYSGANAETGEAFIPPVNSASLQPQIEGFNNVYVVDGRLYVSGIPLPTGSQSNITVGVAGNHPTHKHIPSGESTTTSTAPAGNKTTTTTAMEPHQRKVKVTPTTAPNKLEVGTSIALHHQGEASSTSTSTTQPKGTEKATGHQTTTTAPESSKPNTTTTNSTPGESGSTSTPTGSEKPNTTTSTAPHGEVSITSTTIGSTSTLTTTGPGKGVTTTTGPGEGVTTTTGPGKGVTTTTGPGEGVTTTTGPGKGVTTTTGPGEGVTTTTGPGKGVTTTTGPGEGVTTTTGPGKGVTTTTGPGEGVTTTTGPGKGVTTTTGPGEGVTTTTGPGKGVTTTTGPGEGVTTTTGPGKGVTTTTGPGEGVTTTTRATTTTTRPATTTTTRPTTTTTTRPTTTTTTRPKPTTTTTTRPATTTTTRPTTTTTRSTTTTTRPTPTTVETTTPPETTTTPPTTTTVETTVPPTTTTTRPTTTTTTRPKPTTTTTTRPATTTTTRPTTTTTRSTTTTTRPTTTTTRPTPTTVETTTPPETTTTPPTTTTVETTVPPTTTTTQSTHKNPVPPTVPGNPIGG